MDLSKFDSSFITQVVRDAVQEIMAEGGETVEPNYGIFDSMNEAVEASVKAQQELLFSSMEKRQLYVDTIRKTVLDKQNLEVISRLSVDETEIGKYEHKLIKNALAATKTPGTEDLITEAKSGDGGLTLI